jgi:branched-chain amino acid transport system substrate-binding protein
MPTMVISPAGSATVALVPDPITARRVDMNQKLRTLPTTGATAVLTAVVSIVALAGCTATDAGTAAEPAAGTDSPGSPDAATAPGDDSTATGGEPVVIGVANGQSGFMSFFDGPALNGMEMAVEAINEAGGVDGRPLQIVTADHKSDVNQITAAALSVIDQGADVVLASCDYDFGAPAAREAEKAGLLSMGCAGSPLFGREGIGPLTFNAYSGTPSEAAVMASFIRDQGWSRPYLLQDTSIEYSKTVCDYFEQTWTEAGGAIAGKDTFSNADASIASQTTRLGSADADVVVLCSYPPGGAAAVKQIRSAGQTTPVVGAGAFDGSYWLEAVPDLSDFHHPAFGALAGDDPSPERNEFFASYETFVGEPAPSSTYALMGYSMIQSIAAGIEAAGGSTTGTDLAAALQSFDGEDLLIGPTSYTADCHIPVDRPWLMISITEGRSAFVAEVSPEGIAAAPC